MIDSCIMLVVDNKRSQLSASNKLPIQDDFNDIAAAIYFQKNRGMQEKDQFRY